MYDEKGFQGMPIKERIIKLRKNVNLTQKELAAKTGISQSTLGNWESGASEPKSDKTNILANFFGVPFSYLAGFSNERPETSKRYYKEKTGLMNEKFILRLKNLRKFKKVGQVELSKAIHVSKSTVASWESGVAYPRQDKIEALAKYFSVPVAYLLGYSDKEHPENNESQLSFTKTENELLGTYKQLELDNQAKVLGFSKELLINQNK